MTEEFIIPLNGLKPGKKSSSWHVGTDLFRDFGNTDILDADLTPLWKSPGVTSASIVTWKEHSQSLVTGVWKI